MLSRKEKKVKLKRIVTIFLRKPPYQRIGKGAFFHNSHCLLLVVRCQKDNHCGTTDNSLSLTLGTFI